MKIFFFFLLLASTTVGARTPSSLAYRTWADFVQHEIDRKGIQNVYPDTQYLKAWQEDGEVVMDKRPPAPIDLNQVSLNCKDKRLYPTHPQQTTKEYLYALYAYYDHGRLPPRATACLRPNPTNRFCVRADYAKLVVISDTFEDNCGNTYRGYWMVNYLKGDESMGTLLSKGRTVYEKPHSQFKGEFITGNTYGLRESDFLFLSTIWKGDAAKIKRGKSDALNREGYHMNGKQFINE